MTDRRPDVRRVTFGFLVAGILLCILLYVVGIGDVVTALRTADVTLLAGVVVAVAAWVGVWTGSLHLVFRSFDVPSTPSRSVAVFTTMMFWDNVTPFSTIAADPLAAWTVSRSTDVAYEKALAVVVTVDTLNFAPSPVLAFLALLYVQLTVSLAAPTEAVLRRLAGVLVGLLVVASLAWRYRRLLVTVGIHVATVLGSALGRIMPGMDQSAGPTVHRRVDALVSHGETVAANPRTLIEVLLLATTGWLLLSTVFWLSMRAVGAPVPLVLAILLIPLATVAELAPIPGGVGGVEPVAVALLVALTAVPAPDATAGVLVFRAATYWLPTLVGGAVMPVVSRR
jgi:hypothetical protein